MAAAGTAVALSASGGIGTGVLGGSTGSSALSAAESAVVRNIQSNLTKAQKTARQGKPQQAWRQLKLRQGREQAKSAVECWAFSFGQVQEFFARTPCADLHRVQFPLTDDNGNTVSVLVSKVRMRSTSDARELRRLIDEHGTGDIRPLVENVPFTGEHYDSKVSGKVVVLAETEPTSGEPSPVVLETISEAAVALTPK
ncbi:hypothetical protein [Saccharopolyspora sp. NPDC002686]|uniref:hypothetical protein n=1 Tax=Saccharopolyspora sp. NPDC002686 TaxID=3154541 RepID=UPI00331B6E99